MAKEANPPPIGGEGSGTTGSVNSGALESRRDGAIPGLLAIPNGIVDNATTAVGSSNVAATDLQPWFWDHGDTQQGAPSRPRARRSLSAPTSSAILQGTGVPRNNQTRTLALELQTPTASGVISTSSHNNTTADARQGRSRVHLPRLRFPTFFPDTISLESIELDNMDEPQQQQQQPPVQARASNSLRVVGGFIRGVFYAIVSFFRAIHGFIRIAIAWFFYPFRVAVVYILYPFRVAWRRADNSLGWVWSEESISYFLFVLWIGLFINMVVAGRALSAINNSSVPVDSDEYIDAVIWFCAGLTALVLVGCFYNYRQAGIDELGAARRYMSRADREFIELTNRPRRRGYPPPPPQPHRRPRFPEPTHPADSRGSRVVFRTVSKSKSRVKHLKNRKGKKTTDATGNDSTNGETSRGLPLYVSTSGAANQQQHPSTVGVARSESLYQDGQQPQTQPQQPAIPTDPPIAEESSETNTRNLTGNSNSAGQLANNPDRLSPQDIANIHSTFRVIYGDLPLDSPYRMTDGRGRGNDLIHAPAIYNQAQRFQHARGGFPGGPGRAGPSGRGGPPPPRGRGVPPSGPYGYGGPAHPGGPQFGRPPFRGGPPGRGSFVPRGGPVPTAPGSFIAVPRGGPVLRSGTAPTGSTPSSPPAVSGDSVPRGGPAYNGDTVPRGAPNANPQGRRQGESDDDEEDEKM
ncbi:hypothetical protein GGS26DRAFT_596128 [Hypomontagnella submonticulosa]|nr:hypothetical protein GGS26DRAFT_596128 [Hypomontagnella submonticulosa]